jgi:hypothetical protein
MLFSKWQEGRTLVAQACESLLFLPLIETGLASFYSALSDEKASRNRLPSSAPQTHRLNCASLAAGVIFRTALVLRYR